jgi:hypothetical protein
MALLLAATRAITIAYNTNKPNNAMNPLMACKNCARFNKVLTQNIIVIYFITAPLKITSGAPD